jgi:glucose/arabinose dehydrogenase
MKRFNLLSFIPLALSSVVVLGGGGCGDDSIPPKLDARAEVGPGRADGPDASGGPGGDAAGGAGGSSPDAAADAPRVPDAGMIVAERPERRDFSPALLAQLRVPSGFKVTAFASNLVNPRMLAVAPDGSIYVTIRDRSEVVRLLDGNGDGDADDPGEREVVLSKTDSADLEGVHGIAINAGKVYLASVKSVFSATLSDGGHLTGLTRLFGDLPDGGQHPNRTLAVGPDGKLHITVGSSCNNCVESNSEAATFLRVETSGANTTNPASPQHPILARNPAAVISPRVYVSGLRNTLGFDWNPTTRELWGFDQGSDGLGDDVPPEELDHLVGGKAYGWPFCWGNRLPDPTVEDPSRTLTKQAYCATTEPSTLGVQAHSSPIGFLFYTASQFPADYRGDAFVTLRGSWNRAVPTGYKVVRIHFAGGVPTNLPGQSIPTEDFLSGFLIEGGAAHFGRIAGLAVDATGALLVAEDTNGILYRISYGSGAGPDGGARPDTAADAGPAEAEPMPIDASPQAGDASQD